MVHLTLLKIQIGVYTLCRHFISTLIKKKLLLKGREFL